MAAGLIGGGFAAYKYHEKNEEEVRHTFMPDIKGQQADTYSCATESCPDVGSSELGS